MDQKFCKTIQHFQTQTCDQHREYIKNDLFSFMSPFIKFHFVVLCYNKHLFLKVTSAHLTNPPLKHFEIEFAMVLDTDADKYIRVD